MGEFCFRIVPWSFARLVLAPLLVAVVGIPPQAALGQGAGSALSAERAEVSLQPASFSLADILSPGFAYGVVSARDTDRIAWLENEEGRRNVYTAAAPDFEPVRLSSVAADDGVDLSDLQISDDGSVVVFIRGHRPNQDGWVANPASDPRGGAREVWAASTRGGSPWRVVSALDIALSPDGRWVLHVRDGQIHRAEVDPGTQPNVRPDDTPPLFRAFGQNRSPIWSPDGRRVAFVSERESHSFVGVYDTRERTITYLAPGVDRDSAPVWSPDGRRVAFVRRPGASYGELAEIPEHVDRAALPEGLIQARFAGGYTLSIWVADTETGEGYELWHNAPGEKRFDDIESLAWGDGHLLFRSEPDNWRHFYSVGVAPEGEASGRRGWREEMAVEPVHLTPGEGFVEEATLSPDGRYLVYATNIRDIDRRHIWSVPVGGGEANQVTRGDGIETFPAVLASGDLVAHTVADARRPQSVAVTLIRGGASRIVSRALPDRFPLEEHVVPENVVIVAEDGLSFHNQLFLPPDLRPGERRPALIFIHGGPARQMLLGYNYGHFYHMAYAVNQYFANKGYVVLSVNFRRGIGYGREFRTAPNTREQGMEEYQDILAAGLYIRDREDVDATRIALWGLSYGGTLTAQGLARNSDVFAAGVDIAGVHFFTEPRHELPEVVDPDAVAYRSSSAPLVEDWRSPILLVHGDDDRNVPFFQTVGLVQLLRAHDVPHEVIVFPDDVHSFLLHRRWLQTFEAMDDFLDRMLIPGREATGEP